MQSISMEPSQNFHALDLSNHDFSKQNLTGCHFQDVNFSQANFEETNLTNVWFENCLLSGANLTNSQLIGTDLRGCNLRQAKLNGANLYRSRLEGADLTDVASDKNTSYFHLRCPETGPFLAYKKSFNNLLVQLLVPAEAKRSSATDISCRCDRAKVLSIKSFDFSENYNETMSYADPTFIYKVGELMIAENFNDNRWADSTGGIHFFMTRAEAAAYL